MYQREAGTQREVMDGMSGQPGPWLSVTEMAHAPPESADKTDGDA